jgi:sulfatase modifying factor 1
MQALSRFTSILRSLAGAALLWQAAAHAQPNPAGIDWQPVGTFQIARTETTVAQFRRHAEATRLSTQAERSGGGEVFEAGWTKKPGWTWRAPFGTPAGDEEPAVHITWPEAQAFCRWAGGRLPTDAEWLQAAYTEQRAAPPPPFERGRRYTYPSGDSPAGAACLGDCGAAATEHAVRHGAALSRGAGHVPATRGTPGVNGLLHMGANAWEWVDEPAGASGPEGRRTRGGSWWYGAAQMQAGHLQSKPPGTAVVYIGFRCVR